MKESRARKKKFPRVGFKLYGHRSRICKVSQFVKNKYLRRVLEFDEARLIRKYLNKEAKNDKGEGRLS